MKPHALAFAVGLSAPGSSSSRSGLWRGPSPRLQATSRLRPFADPCLRLAAAFITSKGISGTFPVNLLSTSSHRQRGLPSGKTGADAGSVSSATHLSQVSGEIHSSAAPVSRSTKAGGRSPRGTRLRLRVVTPPPSGPHRARGRSAVEVLLLMSRAGVVNEGSSCVLNALCAPTKYW